MNDKTPESSLGRRMSDIGGLKITKAASMSELKVPEGWRSNRKEHRQGQHDKSDMLDAEMNPDDNVEMSDNEYEYWRTLATSDPVTQGEIKYADDGKKYTHTYKDSKTGKTRKVRYGAKGYKIAPGTKRGDSYCARSEGDMKSEGMDCSGSDRNTPMCLSRKKWRCRGAKSV
jgi:hypothetical protein